MHSASRRGAALIKRLGRRVFVDSRIHRRFAGYSMIPREAYLANLAVASGLRAIPGCVVECGTWRGGMIAGLATLLGPDRHYYLFDSFAGLPPARPIDGEAAIAWQSDRDGKNYYDNCTASEEAAREAMRMSGAPRYTITKGWFQDTLAAFRPDSPIALLRLDCDWYDSTLACLESLYRHVSPQGLIIIDDYYTWDGCSRAVHAFLARYDYAARIRQERGVCVVTPSLSTGDDRAGRTAAVP